MLTILTVEDRENSLWRKHPMAMLPVNSLKVRKGSIMNVPVRHLRYICRNGRIGGKRICRRAKEGRENLLNFSRVKVPSPKITMFSPALYRGRMSINMAVACLQAMHSTARHIKVGLYDKSGDYAPVCEAFLELVGKFTVVTDNTELYEAEARRLMWEKGAAPFVSRRINSLSSCSLIIAPSAVETAFSPEAEAVLLTSSPPSVGIPCRVYSRYTVKLPEIEKEWEEYVTDGELIAAGLYTLAGVYNLGSLVPLMCHSERDSQTYVSLGRHLEEHFSK
ncbi:MAG: hypothetical protein IJD19_03485 [Ruminococcus sp.]|nr:hypothetical protein [Ruminococcus sp.]